MLKLAAHLLYSPVETGDGSLSPFCLFIRLLAVMCQPRALSQLKIAENRRERRVLRRARVYAEADFARAFVHVADPHLFVLCDLYHMYYENEPMSNIVDAGGWIRHAHISAVDEARGYPALGDGFDYGPFFSALKSIGYDDRITLECFDMNIDAGIKKSLPLFRKYL